MHRTLKHSLGQPAASNLKAEQRQLDAFRQHYNEQRPHEALAQQIPCDCYQSSTRPFPKRLPIIEYPCWFDQAKVHSSGLMYWHRLSIYIGNLLQGQHVGIEAAGDGLWDVYFGPVKLGRFDERRANDKNYISLKV